MDCHALDLPDDSFDVTGSQFGVMLVPDQPRALREMVRVTKPGGRVLVIAYGSPEEFESLQIFIGALKAVEPDFAGLPDDPPPLEFQVSDPDVLRQRLTEAGLKDVRVERTVSDQRSPRGRRCGTGWCTATQSRACWSQTSARTTKGACAKSSTRGSASAPMRTGELCSRTRSTSASGQNDAPWIERKPQRRSTTNSSLGIGRSSPRAPFPRNPSRTNSTATEGRGASETHAQGALKRASCCLRSGDLTLTLFK